VNDPREVLASGIPYLFMLVVAEPMGMAVYLLLVEPEALDGLVGGGVGVPEVADFLLASPGRLGVAGGIALACLYLHLQWESGSTPTERVH